MFALHPRSGGLRQSRAPQTTASQAMAGPPRLPRLLLGSENRLAAQILQRRVDGDLPTPLVFWGDAGIGKTTLLEALRQSFDERFGPKATLLRTARAFAREFSNSVHTRTAGDFRQRCASSALVALDDFDQIASAPAAQQELICLIDDLEERGGCLAVAAPRPPERLPNIDARLRSRLTGGLVVRVALPGTAARRRMLEDWNEALPVPRPAGELQRLAETNPASGSELFTALTRTSNAKSDVSGASAPRLAEIAQRTAQAFHVSLADLKGPSRERTRCDARGVAMALARELTGQSYAQIGRYFGGRDHTTVRHQCRRIGTATLLRSDLRQVVQRLRQSLVEMNAAPGKTCRAVDDAGTRGQRDLRT